MLLHDRFVANPQLAEPLVPDRVVVGDELRVSNRPTTPSNKVLLGSPPAAA
jgi:hypothetical protein